MGVRRRRCLPTLLLLAMPQALSEGLAGELSVGLGDLFRGIEVNQSEPGLRGYVEYSAANGLYAGLWAGSYNVPADSRSTEVNYLLGYNHRLSSAIAFDTAIVRYEYPGAPSWLRDYDWTEWLSSLHIGDRWIFTYGLSDNWLVPEGRTHSGWITYQFPLPRQLTLDLKAGAVRIAEGGLVDGYQFYELGLSRTIGSFGGRVAVATTDRRLQRALGDEMAGVHASLQLSWFF